MLVYATRRDDPHEGQTVVLTKTDRRSVFGVLIEKNDHGYVIARVNKPDHIVPYKDVKDVGIVVGSILP